MKAIMCRKLGPPEDLTLEEVPDPAPGSGQVLIRVHAAGVNFPDTLIIRGAYQQKPQLPFTPGGEVAGVVEKVGGGVETLREGDRVLAPMGWGGFAEKALAECWRVVPIPNEMDFVTAASFGLVYGTSYHALRDRAVLEQGQSLLVLGAAGGVGLAAVELGKAMGAHVIAAASSDEKLELCARHGADELIHYGREDLRSRIKEITGGRGVDVIYDPIGGSMSEPALRSMAWGGRYLVVGFAAGEIPKVALNLPLLKGCSIVGVFWGAFCRQEPARNISNMRALLTLYSEEKIRPHISKTFSLYQVADAMNALLERSTKGKLVVRVVEN